MVSMPRCGCTPTPLEISEGGKLTSALKSNKKNGLMRSSKPLPFGKKFITLKPSPTMWVFVGDKTPSIPR
jgi:hypothetical protein